MKVKLNRKLAQHKAGAIVDYDESTATWLIGIGAAVARADEPTEPDPDAATDGPEPAKPPRRRRAADTRLTS